jgi:hypothetical protein
MTAPEVLGVGGTFRREGEFWTIAYRDAVCRLRDSKGLHYLARLLTCRGDRIAAVDLVGANGLAQSGEPQPAADELGWERARVNVTRAVSSALRRIAEHHPELAAHLTATVHTGRYCSYRPDPHAPVDWDV